MPIVRADVGHVLGRARAFYKRGDKSTNKVYLNPAVDADDPDNPDIRRESDKRYDRNFNALDEDNDLRRWNETLPFGADEGALIVDNEFTRGNCEKMAKVVLYYCRRSATLLPKGPRFHMAEVVVPNFFTHVFVVVSEPCVTMFEFPTIARMASRNPPASGAWVIDCWLNVACRAPEYASQLRAKMDAWRAYGKVVIDEQGNRFDNPDLLAQVLVTKPVRYTLHA